MKVCKCLERCFLTMESNYCLKYKGIAHKIEILKLHNLCRCSNIKYALKHVNVK